MTSDEGMTKSVPSATSRLIFVIRHWSFVIWLGLALNLVVSCRKTPSLRPVDPNGPVEVALPAKGAYTGQGVLVVANNGEVAGGMDKAPFELPLDKWSKGPEEAGVLAEWDGKSGADAWRIISRRQHTDEQTAPHHRRFLDRPRWQPCSNQPRVNARGLPKNIRHRSLRTLHGGW